MMESNFDYQVQMFSKTFSKSLNFQFLEMKKSTGIILILFFSGSFVYGAVQRRIQENSWVCNLEGA